MITAKDIEIIKDSGLPNAKELAKVCNKTIVLYNYFESLRSEKDEETTKSNALIMIEKSKDIEKILKNTADDPAKKSAALELIAFEIMSLCLKTMFDQNMSFENDKFEATIDALHKTTDLIPMTGTDKDTDIAKTKKAISIILSDFQDEYKRKMERELSRKMIPDNIKIYNKALKSIYQTIEQASIAQDKMTTEFKTAQTTITDLVQKEGKLKIDTIYPTFAPAIYALIEECESLLEPKDLSGIKKQLKNIRQITGKMATKPMQEESKKLDKLINGTAKPSASTTATVMLSATTPEKTKSERHFDELYAIYKIMMSNLSDFVKNEKLDIQIERCEKLKSETNLDSMLPKFSQGVRSMLSESIRDNFLNTENLSSIKNHVNKLMEIIKGPEKVEPTEFNELKNYYHEYKNLKNIVEMIEEKDVKKLGNNPI